jgi:hypothetical protein
VTSSSNTTSLHLTDVQLDDLLIGGRGDLPAVVADHFTACELCRRRLAEAEAPVASFRDMSLAWAERRSATLPLHLAAPSAAARRLNRASLLTAAAAGVAVAIALPVFHHAGSAPAAPAANLATANNTAIQSITPVSATPEQIAQDNQVLYAIDRALDAPPETAATFNLEPATSRARAHSHKAAVSD